MSKLFIGVGCLIIAVLFTALIGPHFVDWTAYRDRFEREATAYVGLPVTVAGKADVRLLPTPVVTFTDVRIGDPDRPDVTMERFSAEFELAPLLTGDIRVVQMTVDHPHLAVDVAALAKGREALAEARELDPDRVALERVRIVDGSAEIDDSRAARTWHMESVDAVVEMGSLIGPGKLTGDALIDGKPISAQVSLGRLTDKSAIALKVGLTSPDFPVTLQTDGNVHLPTESTPLIYEGTATVEGARDEHGVVATGPWGDFRASGQFVVDPLTALAVKDVQISYGGLERPLILQADGRLGLGADPRFDLRVSARQIDVDRALGGSTESPVAVEDAVKTLVDRLPRTAPPSIPGSLQLDAEGVVVGGSVIQGVGVALETAGDAWKVTSLQATLPGDTDLAVSGTLDPAGGGSFRGHAHLKAGRAAALAAWWRGDAGPAARLGGFSLDSDLDFSPEDQRLTDFVATTRGGSMRGSIDVRRPSQSGGLFVTVGLSAERADLLELRGLAALLAGKTVTAGTIEQMTLTLGADVLSAGGIEAHAVSLDGGLDKGRLDIRRLTVADLAGATVDAHGSIADPFGSPSGSLWASVKADDISGAATFAESLAPGNPALRHLVAVAPMLSPAVADLTAEIGADGGKLSVELNGSFAATHVTLSAAGSGRLDDPATLKGRLKLHVDGDDSATVLTQIGLTPLPVRSAPLRLDADFDGAVASGGKLSAKGSVAGIDLAYAGETGLRDERVAVTGTVEAKSEDIDTALVLAGIAVPGIGEGHAASASGRLDYAARTLDLALDAASFAGQPVGGTLKAEINDGVRLSGALDLQSVSLPLLAGFAAGTVPERTGGAWSTKPFATALPEGLGLDFTLTAKRLDLGAPLAATDAKLGFSLAGGTLRIDLNEAALAGGSLKGAVDATLHDGKAEVSLRAGLSGGVLQSLVWESDGLPVASGTLDLSFEALGRGTNAAEVVASLDGAGTFALGDGRLNALNPEALKAVMSAATGKEEPDVEKARETFAILVGSGALAFGKAAGSFSISSGVVGIGTVSVSAGDTTVLALASIDLDALTLTSNWTVRVADGGADDSEPTIRIAYSGPIAQPDRRFEIGPLLDLLRSRYLKHRLDELEAWRKASLKAEAERRAAEGASGALPDDATTTGSVGESGAATDPAPAGSAPADEAPAAAPAGDPPAGDTPAEATPPADAPPGDAASGDGAATPDLSAAAPDLSGSPGSDPAAEPPPEPEPAPARRAAAPPSASPRPRTAPSTPDISEEYKTLPNGIIVKVR